MLPGITSIKAGIKTYESLPEFKEKVKIFGVIAIGIKTLKQMEK